ncbi:MAG: FMN-binding protein [Planctomycetes bacterium]|nr:FMN-binding protein [Planctomycetota bacterium]
MTQLASDRPPEAVEGPGAARLAGTLGIAGLISGLLLVIAYELTLPRIERNRADALRRAVLEVVPGSTAMQKLVWTGTALVVADGGESQDAPAIHAAYGAGGEFLGYAIPGEAAGFQDVIKLLYGFDPARRRIVGMRVLESKETPGLGDKIYKDPAFARNFEELAVEPAIVAVKTGTRRLPHEVDAITGATISSKAVVRILNGSFAAWASRLPAPGSEPALRTEGTR